MQLKLSASRQLVPTFLIPFLLLLTAAVATAEPNQDATPEFDDLVEVSEVLLDVLVTDKQGNVVVGLEPSDFVVTEAGEQVDVTDVSFYSNRFEMRDDASGIKKPAAGEVLADRHFVLFFHDQRLTGIGSPLIRRQLEAAREAQRWIDQEMLQGDWVAVVSYDVKLKVQSDFTQSREELIQAVKRAAKGTDPSKEWASRRPMPAAAGAPSLLSHLPEGKALRAESKNIYDGISLVAEATRDIIGRKNLMMFTIGFGDIETFSSRAYAEPDRRYYPGLRESLNDNNVAVYPIDLFGPTVRHAQSDFLARLASDTGGYYYENFVSFITPMKEIADEANGYYLLSYQAEHQAGDFGYREVDIKAANPQFKVRARQGYRFGS